VSANTVIRYHANIYKALSDAMKDGLIADNPAKKVHKPKAKQYIAEYYTKDELKALFKAVKGTKIEFAVLMAGFYGLRREEIVGLKWSAIHFEEKTITIKHTVVECNVDGKYQIVARDMGKTKKSIRTLPLIPAIEELLRQIKVAQEKDKEFFGLDYYFDDEEYICRETNGRLMKPNTITRTFARIIEKNKHLKKIRFHDLRHSCATLLRREGVEMADIQNG
jgi:integrase